ncbi:uncharacterized protein LOC128675920 isoform X2 [Plodia interpunctella]|uniref:uncharacterized protein LOC128675920 isoform X2 n=1 Tax=Plodia interpunctella TaxID=58824 RepID=UPI002368C055|nr:uncharacterized protein LOC128675920 isoform X2 [Plodia interpunctella]
MAKPMQKERENRSAEKRDYTFHPYTITPESAHTSILLLESTEPEILCQTLRAITKFSAQDMQNRYVLYNLNAVKYILPHVEHAELNIKRFSLKALAQLCQLPQGPEQVLEDPRNLRKIAHMMVRIEDVYVLEFSSLVLAELTREPLGCEQLVSANVLGSIFYRMKNIDPDVQRNCIMILSHLLDDPVCASEVTKNQQFTWPPLLKLMQSKYLAIQQTALKTVDQLICRYKDETVQQTFRLSTGVLDLCDILETYEFRDVHAQVLSVLKNYAETEENSAHLYQSGCLLRLLAYLDTALPLMKPNCLAVLTKMSFTSNGRDAIYQTSADMVFCNLLTGNNLDLIADAALGIANLTKLAAAANRIAETNIVESLTGILSDDNVPWFYVRLNVLKALCELCNTSNGNIPRAAYTLVENKTFASVRNINRKVKDVPVEAQRMAIQCYINLQSYDHCVNAMLNADFIQELINILLRPDVFIKIMTCTVLCSLMREAMARELFTLKNGEEVVSNNLRTEHVAFRTALCTLIICSVTDEGADVYLELGTVQYMVENKQARYCVSAWEPAIEAIFRHHSSAKFAYCGKLDINDFTQEGFYVPKRLGGPFPTLSRLMEQKPPFRHPVFICTFHKPDDILSSTDVTSAHQSETNLGGSSERLRLLVFPDDYNLRSYVEKVRSWFPDTARDRCNQVTLMLKKRAQLLAEFVAEQMSGVTVERDCSSHSVTMHITELMLELHSSVIGLGWVRCGGALERALLYKVLADKVAIPCALYRHCSAKAWCEVAVPEPDPDAPDDKMDSFPAGLIRVNYVVDLMEQPGRLLKRGSEEARRICGPTCSPPYTSGKLPEVCSCEK